MNIRTGIVAITAPCAITIALIAAVRWKHAHDERVLAESLAFQSTRQAAVEEIVSDPARNIPILLSWTRRPPSYVEDSQRLRLGMVNAFAELKTKEAIPFLVGCISWYPYGVSFAPWLKVADAVERQLPCVGALIQIGPDASRYLIRRTLKDVHGEDRLAAIFVVSRIRGVPEAEAFLRQARDLADKESSRADEPFRADERIRAEAGLRFLGFDR